MEIFKLFGSIFVDTKDAEKSISKTEGKAEGFASKLGTGIKTAAKWGTAVAAGAAAAGAGVIALSKPLVEAAAGASALEAQFEQVFANMGEAAQGTIDSLGADFGMLPNRIKPSFTQMTSMFKGLGMDTETAMGTAKDAVTMVADAAAFYDKSFEDANSSLNSFIKGNYEGGESIGLFANETQLAAFAAKELELDWKKLDEAGKQVARLEYAKAMQEAAGATGQAARESEGYENVMGNLRQAWGDLKVRFGEPILGTAVKGIQGLTKALSEVDIEPIIAGIEKFIDFVNENLMPIFRFVFDWVKDKMPEIKAGFSEAFEYISEIIKLFVDAAKAYWAVFGDYIMSQAKTIFETVKGVVRGAFDIIKGILNTFIGLFTGDWKRMGDGLKQIWSGLWQAIESTVRGAWGLLSNAFSFLWSKISGWFTDLKDQAFSWGKNMISGFVDGIKSMGSAVANAASGVVDKAADFIKFWSPAKKGEGRFITQWGENMIDGFLDGVRKAMPSVESTFGNVIPDLSDLTTTPTSIISQPTKSAYEPQVPNIIIQSMSVRDDNDIQLIARELFNLNQLAYRGGGTL